MTLELAAALHALGDGVVSLEVAEANELLSELRLLGLDTSVSSMHPARRRPRFSVGRVVPGPWSIGGRARRAGVDAVVSVMDHPLSGLGALCVRLAGVPLVTVVHDARPHLGEHKPALQVSAWMNARLATRIVVLSGFVREQLVGRGVRSARIDVIPHGPFYAGGAPTPRPEGSIRVLFFGRIAEYKGLDLLIDAWPEVVKALPAARLAIVGEGDLTSLAAQLAVLPSVDVRNAWIPDADVPAVIRGADLVVLPYREASQSGVVGVARSLGVPVLVTDVGGLKEQVRDRVDGMVTTADPRSIAEAIIRFFTGPASLTGLQIGPRAGEAWPDVARSFQSVVAGLRFARSGGPA